MKDMVSNVRTSRERPTRINKTFLVTMVAYWDTEEANNGGLLGPTSYQQVQVNMEEQLGRHVNAGEVFVKTHIRAYGNFVDRKAQKITEAYEKKLQDKLSEIQVETSCVSNGTSRIQELTTSDYTISVYSLLREIHVAFLLELEASTLRML